MARLGRDKALNIAPESFTLTTWGLERTPERRGSMQRLEI
jgi:hypothetical protein